MTLTAIKPVFDQSVKMYGVDVKTGDHLLINLVSQGYYVTDNIAATLGKLVAGKLDWYNRLPPAKQTAVRDWLMLNV